MTCYAVFMRIKADGGFTLLELLIVVLLVGLLLSIATLSYGEITKRSRDSRRKTDLEEVRSALEQYRSNNNAYPTPFPTPTDGLPFGTSGLTDSSGNIYVQKLSQDPRSPSRKYYYATQSGDFTLAVHLENADPTPCLTPPGGDSCGTGLACNYCLGAYGQK